MWSLTDSLSVIVTSSILSVLHSVAGRHGGGSRTCLLRQLSVMIISLDLLWLSLMSLILAQRSMWLSLTHREHLLTTGMMMYVSSAYLRSWFPGVAACRSAALTVYNAGPIAEPCTMLAEIWRSEDIAPPYMVQCECPVKKFTNQLHKASGIFICASFCSSVEWQTPCRMLITAADMDPVSLKTNWSIKTSEGGGVSSLCLKKTH